MDEKIEELSPLEKELSLQTTALAELNEVIDVLSGRLLCVKQEQPQKDKDDGKDIEREAGKIINKITCNVHMTRSLKQRVEEIISELVI